MKYNEVKFYATMVLLIVGLGTKAVSSSTVFAAESGDILYEETDDNFTLEDIPTGEKPSDNIGGIVSPSPETGSENPEATPSATPSPETGLENPEATPSGTPAPESGNQESQATGTPAPGTPAPGTPAPGTSTGNPLDNTEVDEEDEDYNTGREEIPEDVEDEAKRKGLTTPTPTPEVTPTPTPEVTPTPTPSATPTPTPTTPPDLPKTGNLVADALIGFGALGILLGAIDHLRIRRKYDKELYEQLNEEEPMEEKPKRIKAFRKKFIKKSKTKELS